MSRFTTNCRALFFMVLMGTSLGASANFYDRQPARSKPQPAIVPYDTPPLWMVEQVERDLAPFKEKGITSSMLDEIWNEGGAKGARSHLYLRITARGGVLSYKNDLPFSQIVRMQAVTEILERLNRKQPFPDFDLIVTMHDGYSGAYPILTFAKNKYAEGSILIPDFEALQGYKQLTANVLSASAMYPWEVKMKKAIWRGSATGGDYHLNNWESMPRVKIVQHSFASPRDVDARFTSFPQADSETRNFLTARGFIGMFLSPTDHIRFKYLVEVDGNSCSYSRCYWELLSNSVMLKQVSDNIQWYYGGLEQYQHFIPLEADLSDFFMKLHWARSHDKECIEIAKNATEFALKDLSLESTELFVRLLIEEYAKLCHVSPQN